MEILHSTWKFEFAQTGFGRESPGGFISRSDIDASEEDGMDFHRNVVLGEGGAVAPKIEIGEVGPWGVAVDVEVYLPTCTHAGVYILGNFDSLAVFVL